MFAYILWRKGSLKFHSNSRPDLACLNVLLMEELKQEIE